MAKKLWSIWISPNGNRMQPKHLSWKKCCWAFSKMEHLVFSGGKKNIVVDTKEHEQLSNQGQFGWTRACRPTNWPTKWNMSTLRHTLSPLSMTNFKRPLHIHLEWTFTLSRRHVVSRLKTFNGGERLDVILKRQINFFVKEHIRDNMSGGDI